MDQVLDADALVELRALNDMVRKIHETMPRPEEQDAAEQRAAARDGYLRPPPVFLSEARDLTVRGRHGELRVRVLAPADGALGIHVHVHGGGWVLGECDLQDEPLRDLAAATGLCVASVGYRLAPEHPYPVGPDDCEDAVTWLLERGADALDAPARFTIGGESAGAHLALLALLRLRDRHGVRDAFDAATLAYGFYDLSLTPSARRWGPDPLLLSTPTLRWFVEQFTPDLDDDARRDPEVSPLYADLEGLPPAFVSVGALDPLLDDSLFLAARMLAAGADVELAVYPEAPHAFNGFPIAAARAVNDRQRAYLREHLSGATP